ncbi:CU044_2847 family protein [Amycolatopsis nigrescens]|uniref:CU044_2847 family protein n=1 Tax=Amycolatopsis nigrescens TaxID=381445 RepID=UPI00036FFF2A|nr:CU044_2847 family protein [Amycolatopsis nigrescens]
MAEYAKFELEGGGSVSVEVEEQPGVARAAGKSGAVIRQAGESFELALGEVRDAASAALGQFRSMVQRPDEVELKFGVKLDAQIGAVIAKTGLQGQFEIKLKWVRDPAREGRAAAEEEAAQAADTRA